MNRRQHHIEAIMDNMQVIRRKMMAAVFSKPNAAGLKKPVSGAQWSLLMTVSNRQQSSIKEIAEALGITSSATTQSVNELVRMKYLQRRENSSDRRSVVITTSPEFEKHIDEFRLRMAEQIIPLFDALTTNELSELARINRKIVDALETA